MKTTMMIALKYFWVIFILIGLACCHENTPEDCSKFLNENYPTKEIDSSFLSEAINYQKILLERFDESSIKGLKHQAYHVQFYSSHGYGKSVKFEKKEKVCSITVKCKTKADWYPDCKEYQIDIDTMEWNELEQMIYEFNFWTAEQFRANKNVLDGFTYFLDGNRPEAQKCNKKTYNLVARGSPQYDKIGALCENMLDFEKQLKYKYLEYNENLY